MALAVGALIGGGLAALVLVALRARDRARVEASLELPDGTRAVLQGMDEVAVVVDASLQVVAASAPAELFDMHEGSSLPGEELRAAEGQLGALRSAIAEGMLFLPPETVAMVRNGEVKKGDVAECSRIAGLMGLKKTWELLPHCHPLAVLDASLDITTRDDGLHVKAQVRTIASTGVEMEALTAVAVAGLTLHDMVKAVDPGATMNGVRLLTKDGGKRGHWTRDTQNAQTAPAHTFTSARSATVLVASTGGANGSPYSAADDRVCSRPLTTCPPRASASNQPESVASRTACLPVCVGMMIAARQ